jgi:hypothetical protein
MSEIRRNPAGKGRGSILDCIPQVQVKILGVETTNAHKW